MKLNQTLSENSDKETGGYFPSQSFVLFLEGEIDKTDEFYKNLGAEYDITIYEEFEIRFIELRNKFKGKLQNFSDPDYEFINHTEMRRNSIEQILSSATAVAGKFQEARENNRLDRASCTDALENLIYAIKNLAHLIQEQGKI